MKVGRLKIPDIIPRLITSGRWPASNKESLQQNLQRDLFSLSRIQKVAPEEVYLYLYPPPFIRVSDEKKEMKEAFWDTPTGAGNQIDQKLTILLGDFGHGSDAPFALDYRTSLTNPKVIRLRWAKKNEWIECSPSIEDFVCAIGIAELPEGTFQPVGAINSEAAASPR